MIWSRKIYKENEKNINLIFSSEIFNHLEKTGWNIKKKLNKHAKKLNECKIQLSKNNLIFILKGDIAGNIICSFIPNIKDEYNDDLIFALFQIKQYTDEPWKTSKWESALNTCNLIYNKLNILIKLRKEYEYTFYNHLNNNDSFIFLNELEEYIKFVSNTSA